ncbi:hypothetical protein BDN72DRAFT_830403 [Pluteus cervinus]|uniref:Uncharacterized protein n=1 Tax=Pluteus cervinus TaxID=181527 RepID=A0ACD3BI18_9AGAR|nr:hypothetical protein BDN72DRAFT_830403 [Pluteus cervinus]
MQPGTTLTPDTDSTITLRDLSSSKSPSPSIHVREVDIETAATPRKRSWVRKLIKRFSTKYPRSYERLRRYALYWRGPRPMVDLPDPHPLLDIDLRIRDTRIVLPLESKLLRLTRSFTARWVFSAFCVVYIIGFAFFSRAQSFLTPAQSFIGCTAAYWAANDGCGLDGNLCMPFTNSSFEFRCPAQCDTVILQNPRAVGNEEIAFVPLIVGGGDPNMTYRGDTFICAAALQAGVIDRSKGGCGSLELVGNFTDYLPFQAHGLSSIGFPTVFPLSFRFTEGTSLSHCTDLRNYALAFNIFVTCLLFMLLRPRPLPLFWSLVCIGFWHVALFSQPQGPPPILSNAFGSFLPVLFISYGFWRLAFRFTLPAFAKAPIEAAILYGAPFWAGVLTNLTTGQIPIDRLTASDLRKRSGAITALVIIVLIVLAMAINQVRVIRKTGWLPHYAKWYFSSGLVVLVLALLPTLNLRIHHYIIAIALLPATAFPTRLSAIYQGFLLGMFLNGAAAFGLASILQTSQELQQDAPIGTLLPTFLTNSTSYNASVPLAEQLVQWGPLTDNWDGFELLVDDVERFVGTALNFSLAAFDPTLPHFFRLAFTSQGESGDFTMAAALWPNGTWVDPLPGPS